MPPSAESVRREDLAAALAKLTSPTRVSTTPPDRVAYARDLWPRGLIGVRAGDVAPHPPDAIVWPTSTEEVQAIVRFAMQHRIPLVPFGAGSGVCGGTLPIAGGIVVDVKRMKRRLALDRDALTATYESGILGEHLEHDLGTQGFTLGHFPSSIMCSTLGGWLAARSAGQCSSRYGKIEDMVRSVEVVTGTGDRLDTALQGDTGADLAQLLVGSEGTLGIFTRATLAIRPAAETRLMRGFRFKRVEAGCEGIRRVMQRGLRPSVVRLYDELDTAMNRWSKKGAHRPGPLTDTGASDEDPAPLARLFAALGIAEPREIRRRAVARLLDRPAILNRLVDGLMPSLGAGCLLVVGCEGDRALAEAESAATFRELAAAGGTDLGPGPGDRWLAHRYDVSFGQSKVWDAGAFADTMEVATTWDRLLPLYRAVKEAVSPFAFVMAHFSHAYVEGCSIYFTFVAAVPGGGDARAASERRYDDIWRAGLSAVTRSGATISHHHGVGLSKAAFMPDEHGEAMRIFRALKGAFDPHGILNPGKLGL